MTGPVHAMSQIVRDFWSSVTGQSAPAALAVELNDPAAQRPHDLDDPYFDANIQTRMADVIAHGGHKH